MISSVWCVLGHREGIVMRNNRRFALSIIAVFVVAALFSLRLIDLQVVRASSLADTASDRRTIVHTVYGNRGEITAQDGTVLASSVLRFNVTAAPSAANTFIRKDASGKPLEVTVDDAMTEIAALTGKQESALATSVRANPKSNFLYLVKGIDYEVSRKITALGIPYVYLERTSSRTYPEGAVAGNLVGFVGTDGPQAGIECSDNKCLAGKNGQDTAQIGADGVQLPGTERAITPASAGGTITTTINADLQFEVQ